MHAVAVAVFFLISLMICRLSKTSKILIFDKFELSVKKEPCAYLLSFISVKGTYEKFSCGTLQVPLEGFSALQGISGSQKFQIHKAYGSADHLPSAHTW